MVKDGVIERWTPAKSAELYGIGNWGSEYFDISETGEVLVYPRGKAQKTAVSFMDIVRGLRARGMDMPVLIRFSDILDTRIERLNESFRKAIMDSGYTGAYHGVFPIKVNQQQQVIEEIADFGHRYHHGLEAGSKAELMVALTYMRDPQAPIICNGYKDQEFIDLALYGVKMGLSVIIVLEMPSELELVLERAKALEVQPRIGLRARLSARAGGHWNDSGGDRSVFGLNTSQMIDVVDSLRKINMLDCLQLLHFHIGSQIPNIRDIRSGLLEAARLYANLVKEGAKMGMLDIGGGLAVDYDGSHTNFKCSRNYTLTEYCVDVVEVIQKICDEAKVAHPVIISESGRAVVAYYAVLVFNVLEAGRFFTHGLPEKLPDGAPELLRNLMDAGTSLTAKNLQECYNDALFYRDEIRNAFEHGSLSLRERALAEQIFWGILMNIAKDLEQRKYIPEDMQGLSDALADVYYANFSVFQSLPDAWAIDQLFPIMPLHRLSEQPTRKGILADMTCDCDGKIDRFIDLHDEKRTLPLHELHEDEDYILGAFLVGAYQETLGDLHNLMGDTNVVSVRLSESGELQFSREIEGDSVADVLTYVEYDPKEMFSRFRDNAERAVAEGRLRPEDRRIIVEAYRQSMQGYTYFEKA
jgi:arginine decarboxylase